MKKYGLIGGVGLLAVVVIAFFMFRQEKIDLSVPFQEATVESLDFLSYVPDGFEQAVMMDVDAGLIEVMQQVDDGTTYTTGLQESLRDVDTLLATQYATEAGYYSLLFVEADSRVALSEIQEVGLIAGGEGYEVTQLTDNMWLYGTPDSLAFHENYEGTFVGENDMISDYLNEITDDAYNMGFVSEPTNAVGQTSPMVQQFADQLIYTVVRSHLDPADTHGEVILQFTPGVVPAKDADFDPQLAEFAPTDSLIYLEISDLLGMFAIGEEQFVGIMPALLGEQRAAFGAALSSEQYTQMYNVLSDHISISLAPATNMFGVSAEVSFAGDNAFELMNSLRGFWLGLAGGIVGSGTLQELPTNEGFAYGISGLPMVGDQPVLQLERQGEIATLALLGSGVTERGIEGLTYTDETTITFQVDSAGLQEQLSSTALSPIAPSVNSIEQSASYFAGNVLQGSLQLLPTDNQIRITFSVVE